MREKNMKSGPNGVIKEEKCNRYYNPITPDLNCPASETVDLCAASSSEQLLSSYMKPEGEFATSEEIILYKKSANQKDVTGGRSLQLQFSRNIYEPVFTGVAIKGEDGNFLKVALVDCQSGEVVRFGPEASARVEIVALEADFGEGDSWTREEFKSKIVAKEGNKRLLTGNVGLHLKGGIGVIGFFQFSHTKRWKMRCAYKLGAIVMDDDIGTTVKEGFTESFHVKDRRLNLNKKHYPPTLSDEVWRLDGISRDGVFHHRLSDKKLNITTVKDLLKILNINPEKLRDVLGKGMSAMKWEALVAHARTCKIDEGLHFYSSFVSQQETSVLFNVVGQVIGLFSQLHYVAFEILPESEKDHAMNLVISAYQQWDKVESFNDEASFKDYLRSSNRTYYFAYQMKSPTMESSSGIKSLISLEKVDKTSQCDELVLRSTKRYKESLFYIYHKRPISLIVFS